MRKLYLFFIAVLFAAITNAQDYKVAVVSNALPADDAIIQKAMDEINGMDGYEAIHMSVNDLPTATYTDYDAILLTENGGSSLYAAYSTAGWPLPSVILKCYMLYQGSNPLFTQNADDWLATDKSTDLFPDINKLIVKNNDDVLKCYAIDSVVTWTEGYNTTIGTGAGEAHVQAYNLKDATANADVASAATVLADDKYMVDQSMPLTSFMWKVEENALTKRLVTWGVHHDFLEHATDDFWSIIKYSVMWVLDQEITCPGGETGFREISTANIQVYPNPVSSRLNINSAGLINTINLVDVTGKSIMKINDVNAQHYQIDMSRLSKGLYVIQLTTVNGETYTGKVSK